MHFIANLTYFSDIHQKPVFDDRGEPIGLLEDLVFEDGEELAQITHGVVRLNQKKLKFDWKVVGSLGNSIYLNEVKEKVPVSEVLDSDLLVNETLMDKQLVDVNGLKVVRVNDVLLWKKKGGFFISSVAVGTRSLLRRLGLEKATLVLVPNLNPKLVSWSFVQPLAVSQSQLGLKFSRSKINEAHPADIADLLDELSHSKRQILFNALNEERAAETLTEAKPEVQRAMVEHLHEKKMGPILQKLSPSEIVDLFNVVSHASKRKIFGLIGRMDEKIFKKIERLLPYPDEWAGGLMKTEFYAVPEEHSVLQIKRYLKKQKDIEDFHHIYVVNEDKKLVGVVLLKDLFLQKPKTKVKEFMDPNVLYVHLKDPLKKVAKIFSKYHAYALPVVDKHEHLAGIISMNDVFEEIAPKSWKKDALVAKRTHAEKSEETPFPR